MYKRQGRVTLAGADGSLTVGGASSLKPAADNATALGAPAARYSTVYAATGSISTSDRQAKNSIRQLDGPTAQKFVAELLPVTYKLNDGASGRRHWGLIAQDVERAMTPVSYTHLAAAGERAPGRGRPLSADRRRASAAGLQAGAAAKYPGAGVPF